MAAVPYVRTAVFVKTAGFAGLCSLRPLLLVVVLLAGTGSNRHPTLQGANAQSTSSSPDTCQAQLDDCFLTDQCNSCVFSFNEGFCSEYVFDPAVPCQLRGVSYCCGAEASGDLDACLTDGATLDFWECALERSGCELDDMPCVVHSGTTADRGTSSSGAAVGEAEAIDESGVARGSSITAGSVAAAFALVFTSSSLLGLIL